MIGLILAAAAVFPSVETDARHELFGVVQLLAGADRRYSGFFRHPLPYADAAEKRFKPYARHPAVASYRALADKGLESQFFHEWLLTLSPPPELEPVERFHHEDLGLETFRLLLADFARASRFMEFHAQSEPDRRAWVSEVEAQARKLRAKETLEEYAGLKAPAGYRIILSPWVSPSLSGARVSLYGPEQIDGKVVFRLPTRLGALWRQLAFDLLAPAERGHRESARASEAHFDPKCAQTWPECARSLISFAVATRLLERAGDLESAREWPVKYARIGLPHIAALAEALKGYEADRKTYPTLDRYYPKLLETLERQRPGRPPFTGGVAEALRRPDVLVARSRDWLKGLPVTLEPGRIRFNGRYGQASPPPLEGDLTFVTVARHPEDPARPVVVVIGEGMYTGPADYAVLRGSETLRLGSYEKSRLPWRLK